jgi:hypothetical protein
LGRRIKKKARPIFWPKRCARANKILTLLYAQQ